LARICFSALEERLLHKKISFTSLRPKNLKNDVFGELHMSPHGDAILKKLKIWLNACIILLLLLYLTGVIFSANLKFKGKILA
jgi:hypothetical protein